MSHENDSTNDGVVMSNMFSDNGSFGGIRRKSQNSRCSETSGGSVGFAEIRSQWSETVTHCSVVFCFVGSVGV
jgi:hypothetical protein